MNFFKKTWVKVTSWVVFFADLIVLFLAGATEAEVSSGVTLGFSAIAVVAGIVAFITERVKKDKK